jgi:cobalamin biosynthesis Mg chelatase CobN
VRVRAINPRFIAGQMRHGYRGAAELAKRSTAWSLLPKPLAPWRAVVRSPARRLCADTAVRDF